MQRPTLSTFRAQWPQESMGLCQGDPQVRTYCNDAQQRLLFDPLAPEEGWYGTSIVIAMTGTVINGVVYVTTPREIARLTDIAVCQHPISIRNGWFEYLHFGRGLQPKTCRATGCGSTFQAYERPNVYTLSDLVGTKTIRIYPTDVRDVGLRVLLQGKDANGQVILNTDPGTGLTAQGEYVVLAMPFVDSVNTFSQISGIAKDETFGNLSFYQVDPTTLVETPLSSMEPTEGTALYRRYMINGIPNTNLCCQGAGTVQISAQARLDFVPVVSEVDYLTIPNIPSLIEECRSIRFSRLDSPSAFQQAAAYHSRALSLLAGQLDLMNGKTNAAVRVPIFGSQRLTRQPV